MWDTIATYRSGALSMHGIIGDLAKWTVVEAKDGKPSLSLRRYVPFSSYPVAARTGEMASGGSQLGISAQEGGS